MPKQIQGLRKRTGELLFRPEGKIKTIRPIEVNDIVTFFHDNGTSIKVRVDVIQEEGVIIGTVIEMSSGAPGISINDYIVSHENFVFVVFKNLKTV